MNSIARQLKSRHVLPRKECEPVSFSPDKGGSPKAIFPMVSPTHLYWTERPQRAYKSEGFFLAPSSQHYFITVVDV